MAAENKQTHEQKKKYQKNAKTPVWFICSGSLNGRLCGRGPTPSVDKSSLLLNNENRIKIN